MKAYILSVICAAVMCAIAADLSEKKSASAKILKLICGVFLSFTVIRPITDVKLEEFSIFTADITEDAFQIVDLGQSRTYDEMSAIITQEVTAYILDKAADVSPELRVDVELNENLIPCRIMVYGNLSPIQKHRLEEIIEQDLGIGKEDQVWIE